MLVLFSDVHLTDGTSGETISQEAFARFVDQVADLADKRRATDLHVALLGDGLDVIRSDAWLDGRGGVRPWSRPSPAQRRRTLDVLDGVLSHNRRAMEHLREMPYRIASRSRVPYWRVRLDYVLGNHDWMINRYRATRQMAADALGLPREYVTGGFPFTYTSPADEYDVVARHGDVHDRLNHDAAQGYEGSSLGDAIIIDLLNRFPLEVGRALDGDPSRDDLVRHLKEVDNVRPYTLMASWVSAALRDLGAGRPRMASAARQALVRCVRDFLGNPHVRRFARSQLSWLERAYLHALLHQVRRRRVSVMDFWTRQADRLLKGWRLMRNLPGSRYTGHALRERAPDGRLPRFVVYGHSHHVESVPLGPCPRGGDRFYLNTGTWRSVWERGRTPDGSLHFASWKEMSYVVIYAPDEGRGTHEFEIWTGSLRDRGRVEAEQPVAAPPSGPGVPRPPLAEPVASA